MCCDGGRRRRRSSIPMSVFYFAYGSNMSLEQMRKRCPESQRVTIGCVRDHKLVFPRYSNKRNCGVASIAASSGDDVWGVLFELNGDDLSRLDKSEGYRPGRAQSENGYNRISIVVQLAGDPRSSVDCLTYIGNPQSGKHIPSEDYSKEIIKGAEENELPAEYLERLRSISLLSN